MDDAKPLVEMRQHTTGETTATRTPTLSRKPISLGRHARDCRICSHARREEIERDFVNWKSPAAITREYSLKNRATVYRHAHALELFAKHRRNVRAALEEIIERSGEVEVNAAAVVSAVRTYASITSTGRFVKRTERVDLNELFERMSRQEMDAYARDGSLPEWFTRTVGATADRSQDGDGDA